ncbi:hypothetical protein ECBCE001MS16_1583 [Escherichia coli BCE001_MS16]|nr:hypothetical protein ECBCE001MS16_1583 [Escherichia coli BCE001_MS16]
MAVMIVVLINNDQTPYLTYYRILGLTVHATSTHWFQLPSRLTHILLWQAK